MGHCLYWVLGGSMESKPREDGNGRLGAKEKGREEGEVRVQQLGLLSKGFSCFGV